MNTAKSDPQKLGYLRNMYIVLPYIPEIAPDWIDAFDRAVIAPPTSNDVNYLAKTLSDAHGIYMLKTRGGKDGIAVKVENQNPNALPIAIQNIKRELSSIPDKFNNDILTANTRLKENRLDLPIDDFLIDLFALGLENAGIFVEENNKLTAQQAWPFIASAISTQSTPWPCFFFVRACDEIDKLLSILRALAPLGNGYLKRRIETLIACVEAIRDDKAVSLGKASDKAYKEIATFNQKDVSKSDPFDPAFIRKNPLSVAANEIIRNFKAGSINAGTALDQLLKVDNFSENEKRYAIQLLKLCTDSKNKNGLIAVLRSDELKTYHSTARKNIFFIDALESGPSIQG